MNPKLLRALVALSAILTALLGAASYIDLLPAAYSGVAGVITAALLGLKEIVVIVGDIADDGVRNNSFKPDPQKVLCFLLLCFLSAGLPACSSFTGQDARNAGTQIGLAAADTAILVARMQLASANADLEAAKHEPGANSNAILAKQLGVIAAERALDAAERAVAKERARLDAKQPREVQPSAVPGLTHAANAEAACAGQSRECGAHFVNHPRGLCFGNSAGCKLTPNTAHDHAVERPVLMTRVDAATRVTIPIFAPQVVAALQAR